MDGILLVDKAGGGTSHDVVAQARRALGQREVGHAGTLDPMATGLLVVLLGEGTKLSAHLTAGDKAYRATVRFGVETDSLDADGLVTRTVEGEPPSRARVESALAAMVGPMAQVPPAVSAIKTAGVAAHARVRRGESVELAPREVELKSARVLGVAGPDAEIEIECSKGFYVRALARDLAARLDTVAHLAALRRTRSGPFAVDEALPGAELARAAGRGVPADEAAREQARARVRDAVLPVMAAARALRALRVSDEAARALGQGKRLASDEPDGVVLVLDEAGTRAVCVGRVAQGVLSVERGFRPGA